MKKITLIILLYFFLGPTTGLTEDFACKIHFIDVGEGEATLIQTSDGKNILIDTGNLLSGYRLVDYLKENKVETIDHLIITHHDQDHISGVFFILPKFKVQNTYDNGFDISTLNNPVLDSFAQIFRGKESYLVLKENSVLKSGDLLLTVLWPKDAPLAGSLNHNSLVIMLGYKNFSCLFTGDIDLPAEKALVEQKINLRADVLKIAHHGAIDANSEGFLEKISPKTGIISVDAENKRGYPAKKVLELLSARKIKTYRTDQNGTIIVTLGDKTGFSVATQR